MVTRVPILEGTPREPFPWIDWVRVQAGLRAAGPPLLFGVRLWVSVCLALYVAFWLELSNAYWAGTTAAIVCQPMLGASLRKGWFRMIGTVIGAIAIVVLTGCFPQNRVLFLAGLALWCGACAAVATLLRNFAAYAAALAGFTAAIVASDVLGATGGPSSAVFTFAVDRVSEIIIGIVSAGVVLAGTDVGRARRGLAASLSGLTAAITAGIVQTLTVVGPGRPHSRAARRDFIRRVIALDPVIDQAIGESSQIRYHTPVLQRAVDGLYAALSGWRAIANLVVRLPSEQARADGAAIVRCLPAELQNQGQPVDAAVWAAQPIRLFRKIDAAVRVLMAFPATTPAQRLIADQTAQALAGILDALNGVALLARDPARPVPGGGVARLRLPDWLPAAVNGGRACLTIGAVAAFWIVTAWPNGAGAMTWAAVISIVFAVRADQAYAFALRFAAGAAIAAVFAAIVLFAALPCVQTFAGLCLVLGAYLIPMGAMSAQPWEAALFVPMVFLFVPLLMPANQISYDPAQFYNGALGLVSGSCAGVAAYRLLPPLSPAFLTRRLLARTLRDLRRLAAGRNFADWEGHVHGRLSVLPEAASPLQHAQLLVALSVGTEILRLRQNLRAGHGGALDLAFAAIARGSSTEAIANLARADAELATRAGDAGAMQAVLEARGSIRALTDALVEHAGYFEFGVRG